MTDFQAMTDEEHRAAGHRAFFTTMCHICYEVLYGFSDLGPADAKQRTYSLFASHWEEHIAKGETLP
jgi:hypothetical protein